MVLYYLFLQGLQTAVVVPVPGAVAALLLFIT